MCIYATMCSKHMLEQSLIALAKIETFAIANQIENQITSISLAFILNEPMYVNIRVLNQRPVVYVFVYVNM